MARYKPADPDTSNIAYVYSTLSNDQIYMQWIDGGGDIKIPGKSILIKGGTGVMNDRLITPLGVVTKIDAADLDLLKTIHQFNEHVKRGFIRVEQKEADPEKVAADMSIKDGSAPLTPSDYIDAPENSAVPAEEFR